MDRCVDRMQMLCTPLELVKNSTQNCTKLLLQISSLCRFFGQFRFFCMQVFSKKRMPVPMKIK